MNLGAMALSAAAKGSMTDYLRLGNIEHLFLPSELPFYLFVQGHVAKYGVFPNPDTVKLHTEDSYLETIEPADYYFERMTQRHIERSIKKAMAVASENLAINNKNPDAALSALTDMVAELTLTRHASSIVDYGKSKELLWADYLKTAIGNEPGIMTGWPFFDNQTNGLEVGDLLSFVGRPAQGKSWMLLKLSHHAWGHKNPGLFVSMEMTTKLILQRFIAIDGKIEMDYIKKASFTEITNSKFLKALKAAEVSGVPFHVVDGNLTATVEDIYLLARKLKPSFIVIDGGYLVKHNKERDRYRRVAENADLMKQMLSPLAPTVVSWQFSRDAVKSGKSKKKSSADVGLEDIGYTDAIAQVSSLVLGLFEEDSVETLIKRKIRLLKGRSGEQGEFYTNWNFKTMDFNEVESVALGDLKFI